MKKNIQKGFTMIELLVVMSLVGLLAIIAAPTYISMQHNVALSNEALGVLNALRVVQQRSMISQNNVTHSIHFNTTDYVVYSGASDIATITLANGLEFISGAGSDISFERLTGESSDTLIQVGYPGKESKTIAVTSTGVISIP